MRALLILDLIHGLFDLHLDLFNQYWFLLIIAFILSVVLGVAATMLRVLGKTYFLDVALRSFKLLPRHVIYP